ncbi:MAG TPA: hypothetical protein VJB90_04495, partial [Candidatus Nanoarchaeia archaeon]|nr:hypothetical protein [Candidatus Nanoarchaeia archaeon]
MKFIENQKRPSKTLFLILFTLIFTLFCISIASARVTFISSNNFTFAADKAVYSVSPIYNFGLINLTDTNHSTTGVFTLFNISVNITTAITNGTVAFSMAINGSAGNWTPASVTAGNNLDFRFDNVQLANGSILQFRFNVSNTNSTAGQFNVTFRLNESDPGNITVEPMQLIKLGAVNITTANNSVMNTTNISFFYDSVDDSTQNCSLVIDGVVASSNASANILQTTTLAATGIAEGPRSMTVICYDDTAGENVTTSSKRILIDTTPPGLTINFPTSGQLLTGTYLNASITVVENTSFTNLTIFVDGSLVNMSNFNSTNGFNLSDIKGGKHTLFAVALDAAGRITTAVNRTFYFANSENFAQRAAELNTSFASQTASVNITANSSPQMGSPFINN